MGKHRQAAVAGQAYVDLQDARLNYDAYKEQVEAKLAPIINQAIYDIYLDAWNYCIKEDKQPNRCKQIFQQLLGEIDGWDADVINDETERVVQQLPWLREVLKQMLSLQVYILMAVRYDQRTQVQDFEFQLPNNQDIIHKIFARCSRRLRGHVALYDHTVGEAQRAENTLEAEDIIKRCIGQVIENLVPLERVIERHFHKYPGSLTHEEDDEEEEGEEEETSSTEEEERPKSAVVVGNDRMRLTTAEKPHDKDIHSDEDEPEEPIDAGNQPNDASSSTSTEEEEEDSDDEDEDTKERMRKLERAMKQKKRQKELEETKTVVVKKGGTALSLDDLVY